MRKKLFWTNLFVLIMMLLFPLSGKAATTTVWVGQNFSFDVRDHFNNATSQVNVEWDIPKVLDNRGGEYSRKLVVSQYFEGTAYVTCEWDEVWNWGNPYAERWEHRKKTWSVICQSNPVSINKQNLELEVGETDQLYYSHRYENDYTSYASPYFYTTETNVVSVTKSGEITAVGEGRAYVYVHSNISGVTPYCTVNVGKSNSNNMEDDNSENDEEIKNSEGSWSDFGAYNITWYNKTDRDFYISTPEELAGFAYLINHNFSSFSGCTLHLNNNIDLQGRIWNPIGIGGTVFSGCINGHGYLIENVEIEDGAGFFSRIENATIRNVNLDCNMSVFSHPSANLPVGVLTASATMTKFQNIGIKSNLNVDVTSTIGGSTTNTYNKDVGGVVASSRNCTYYDVKSNTNISFKCGKTNGSSIYGAIDLRIGGIIGGSYDDIIDKCQSVNEIYIEINGPKGTYTNRWPSDIFYGGIIGYINQDDIDSDSGTMITSCFAKTTNFKGVHKVGTSSEVIFYYGGIVSSGRYYSNIKPQNCVAINSNYMILGHDWSTSDPGWKTESRFGGISYESHSGIEGCYSNNDVVKYVEKIGDDLEGRNGSTSFSTNQINSQAFVDEINFFNQLAFGTRPWGLDENGDLTLLSDEALRIDTPRNRLVKTNAVVYNLQGMKMKDTDNLPSGIYIRNGKKFIVK